ncbi:hypothetical protein, partial [Vibrio alginolyticus]|uniref:hypothetical protein n=1 Tax=Vibrio alginolyticus TaxID=663 RepID=UPI00193C67AC
LGSRKIGNMAYQQGTTEYTAEITNLMSEKKEGTTEKITARKIQHAASFGIPIRYIHTQANIPEGGNVSDVKVEVSEFKIYSKGLS